MLEISTKSNNYLKMNVYAKNAELEGDINLKTRSLNKEVNQENNPFGEAVSLELSNEYVTEKSSCEDMLRESKVQRTLKQGSKGNDVKTLQSNLNYLGYNVGTADGVFGAKTKNAVIAYQRAHGLEVDGIAGPATQNSIASSVALKKAAEVTKNLGVLQQGSKGEAVAKLQRNLVALGYNPKGTDGIFGADTKAAVMLLQEVCGLTVDGVAGNNTNDAINRALNNKNAGALSRGLISSDVASLQNSLKTLGYYSGSADGIFGAGTESAVRNFQRANGLSQDGVAGAGTKQTIVAALAAKAAAEAAEKAARENGVLQRGSKGDAVVRLQKNLNALGYDTKGTDGIYGNDTRTAVMKFQEVYGLTVDGIVGKETADAINGAINHKNAGELSRGMVSEDVKTFQFNMKALQYYSGVADGVYGAGTEKAVKKFQKDHNLKEDGIINKVVREMIDAAIKYANESPAAKGMGIIPCVHRSELIAPKTGDVINVSIGTDQKMKTAKVYNKDAWSIENTVKYLREGGIDYKMRIDSILSKYNTNLGSGVDDLWVVDVPGYGKCLAGAMVIDFGKPGDLAEIELNDGKKFKMLLTDVKRVDHEYIELPYNSDTGSKQCMNEWGHGYYYEKSGVVQMNPCEFVTTQSEDKSVGSYKSGAFLMGKRMVKAKIIAHNVF